MLKNLTPHAIVYRDANGTDHVIPPSGVEARVSSTSAGADPVEVMPGVTAPCLADTWGPVMGLPAPEPGVTYIVSALVLGRPEVANRTDVVAPGTGPSDNPVREGGQVRAVTRFKRPTAGADSSAGTDLKHPGRALVAVTGGSTPVAWWPCQYKTDMDGMPVDMPAGWAGRLFTIPVVGGMVTIPFSAFAEMMSDLDGSGNPHGYALGRALAEGQVPGQVEV